MPTNLGTGTISRIRDMMPLKQTVTLYSRTSNDTFGATSTYVAALTPRHDTPGPYSDEETIFTLFQEGSGSQPNEFDKIVDEEGSIFIVQSSEIVQRWATNYAIHNCTCKRQMSS